MKQENLWNTSMEAALADAILAADPNTGIRMAIMANGIDPADIVADDAILSYPEGYSQDGEEYLEFDATWPDCAEWERIMAKTNGKTAYVCSRRMEPDGGTVWGWTDWREVAVCRS